MSRKLARRTSSSRPRYFRSNLAPGTRRRISAQAATTSALILARLLQLPKVTCPDRSAGSGETAGASSGGSKQR